MKKHIYIIMGLILFLLASCNEKSILSEVPQDFYSPENSFVTASDFQMAINKLHNEARNIFEVKNGGDEKAIWFLTTDMYFKGNVANNATVNSANNWLFPTNKIVLYWWSTFYKLIFDANVIIGRIDGENTVFQSQEQRDVLKAEALFFRAFAYRSLACLYGGVPMVLEEIKAPKRDFVRATREAAWQQCALDLEFAAQKLPDADKVAAPGRICNGAAYHLLSEVYISLKQWDKAVTSANAVINSGKFALMTNRFGSLKDKPGDVWWDLFRRYNQNRPAGNTEGIWVVQFEYNIAGGENDGYWLERNLIPYTTTLKDPKGKSILIGPTTQGCGRGQGYTQPVKWVLNTMWLSDWNNDIRNSQYNIVRDLVVDNPASTYFGKKVIADNLLKPTDFFRNWYPMFTKGSTPGQHPDEVFADKATGLLLTTTGICYRDFYAMRLAETYLLRAEAYLGKGDKTNAAADINAVRGRAKAKPVLPADVNIDYILDERARELLMEEFRAMTLGRLGLSYERKKRLDDFAGDQISPWHNLWPIPYSEIERNTEAVLEQNPGYK